MQKQVIVWRNDLKVRKGKLAAQIAHASLNALLDNSIKTDSQIIINYSDIKEWIDGIFTKIIVYADNLNDIITVYNKAKELNIRCALITDAGKTEFHGVPTITCCAIGPANDDIINTITSHFKLL